MYSGKEMSEKIVKTLGIIITETRFGDKDKILTVLTPNLGKITVFAKGAYRGNKGFLAGTELMCMSNMILYKGSKSYHLNELSVKENFYDIRLNFNKLDLAVEILKDIFTNTKLVTNTEKTEANANEIKTKDFVGKTVKEVNDIVKAEGINLVLNSKNPDSKVTKQLPRAGTIIDKSGKIYLNTDDSESIKQVEVPDLKKKTREEVINILNSKGLNVSFDGTEGVVMIQDPVPGQIVDTGNVVKVTIKKELAEGH